MIDNVGPWRQKLAADFFLTARNLQIFFLSTSSISFFGTICPISSHLNLKVQPLDEKNKTYNEPLKHLDKGPVL
jgi:hypothetical protein